MNKIPLRQYLIEPEKSCRNCGHSSSEHDSGMCSYFDEDNCTECGCDALDESDSAPMEVDIPPDATRSDLLELAKVATRDGRMIPPELARKLRGD